MSGAGTRRRQRSIRMPFPPLNSSPKTNCPAISKGNTSLVAVRFSGGVWTWTAGNKTHFFCCAFSIGTARLRFSAMRGHLRSSFLDLLQVSWVQTWGICTRRAGKLYKARSRLYRSQILQINTYVKAFAEIYTMHSCAPFFNLKISAKNRQHFFAIE